MKKIPGRISLFAMKLHAAIAERSCRRSQRNDRKRTQKPQNMKPPDISHRIEKPKDRIVHIKNPTQHFYPPSHTNPLLHPPAFDLFHTAALQSLKFQQKSRLKSQDMPVSAEKMPAFRAFFRAKKVPQSGTVENLREASIDASVRFSFRPSL